MAMRQAKKIKHIEVLLVFRFTPPTTIVAIRIVSHLFSGYEYELTKSSGT